MQPLFYFDRKKKPLAPSAESGGNSNLAGKRVLVVGMARSGVAVAQLLHEHGALPVLQDDKPPEQLQDALKPLEGIPCERHFGEDVLPLLKGVDSVVISPGVPVQAPVVSQARQMGIPLVGELEFASRYLHSELCAVTGTNGKTTTVTLLGEIFRNAGRTPYVAGNVGYPLSYAALQSKPEAITIAEVSSFQLETIETFHPKAAALLNITEDHLNRHGTMDEYIRLKTRVFENQTESDFAVINMDDPLAARAALKRKSRVIRFSRKTEPEGDAAFVRDGQIVMRWAGDEQRVCSVSDVRIPGPHNLENALAASAMALCVGVPKAVVRHTLRTFAGVEHRIELVRERDCVRYINDSKGTNADSTIKAIEAMDRPTVIILGGYDKHVRFDALAKVLAASPMIRHAVLIGQTASQIQDALDKAGFDHIHHAETLEEAVAASAALAERDGNVLLSPACASFDMFADYEARGRAFKDIVAAL